MRRPSKQISPLAGARSVAAGPGDRTPAPPEPDAVHSDRRRRAWGEAGPHRPRDRGVTWVRHANAFEKGLARIERLA